MRRIRSKHPAIPQKDPDAQVVQSRREKLQRQLPDATSEQLKVIDSVGSLTMTSPERILGLCNAVDYLSRNQIQGDLVECGVWRGGSMAAAAKTLLANDDTNRTLWLYDTFDGMSEPTDQDVDFMGQSAEALLEQQDRDDAESVWCYSPLDQVKTAMADTGYPMEKVRFVEGRVEDTLPVRIPDRIGLLRLDTDWYESTRCELKYLFPKLVPGGVLIVDDYGHWEGCRRAVDEYLEENNIAMMLNRIDYTGRIGVFFPG